MAIHAQWKKSSYFGGGEGNDRVEIARVHPHIAIRDSKAPSRAALTFPTGAFVTFVEALKTADVRSAGMR
ncbi:DUF397 domain-containing protein [Streptomyces thermodiastaticus]|jgi:hypothetical protein|uniref:DUF397 domain-containing protein n=1 Tax=Streptomyces thermodiastaticus TaxID=44061 RepID=UPI00167AECAC|nr:DUF397 domain-containing protein [Streptomyces thermodiastaticus]MCE7552935.1 DUF397 domain-containing protein [Streptomyces thermodiastaticus]GHF89245.1 hypothetical protein GCM10018787_42370 [Streptomyces thermodiastaticus]